MVANDFEILLTDVTFLTCLNRLGKVPLFSEGDNEVTLKALCFIMKLHFDQLFNPVACNL